MTNALTLPVSCMITHYAAQVPERYFQMLLALHGLQNETFPKGWLTWADWSRTDPSGWHPWDADADSIDEELLFIMRTATMESTAPGRCKAAWDSGALASAEQLLQSYVSETKGWALDRDLSAAGRAARLFEPLQHECVLFARKFKADTVSAVLDMFSHPQYSSWNYTDERMAIHAHDRH